MNILLVDDDIDSRISVKEYLEEIGHQVTEAQNGREALEIYQQNDYPMVLSDIKMPEMSGIELLEAISSMGRNTDIVLFTGFGDMESAIAALRAGAFDYLIKPINVDELEILTERIAEHQALLRENIILTEHFDDKLKEATEETKKELNALKKVVAQNLKFDNICFFSDSMKQIYNDAKKYHTDRSIPVLIQGETGSGKEVIARIIHYGDMKNIKPFVDINCAALTGSLFDSELFGYEAGTFTGGLSKGKSGKLDLAYQGTIFLDEIAEIPIELQGKLLRVIQEKEYYRVGGLKKINTDVRIICATNVDLEQRVKEGKFRKDLYFRLKVGHLVIPPLRERQEDILPLANIFLKEFAKQKKKKFTRISPQAAQNILDHNWPGNVRELKNIIEWITFMHNDTEVKPIHLSILNRKNTGNINSVKQNSVINVDQFTLPKNRFPLEEHINKIISKALAMHHGNKTETALYLGISRSSLYSKLKSIEKG